MEVPDLSNIKIFREKAGLTQQQLAEACGVGQSYIAKIEAGKQNPSYEVVVKIFSTIRTMLLKREENPQIVKNVATPLSKLKYVSPKDTLRDVKTKIGDYDQIPVIDSHHHCVGSITSQLLIRLLNNETSESKNVGEFMESPLPSFSENTSIKQMREILRYIDAALIVNQDQITGIVTRSDVF